MRVPRVYFEGALTPGAETMLSKDQAHYLGRVLRLKQGREILLFNGEGGEYLCRVANLDGKRGTILVQEYLDTDTESPLNICLAIGLSKGDRFDWVVQKATELGVSSIQPLHTEYSEVRLSDVRVEKKVAHWQGIARSACEQSGRTRIPVLNHPCSFSEFLTVNASEQSLVLEPDAEESLSDLSWENSAANISLIVGPEGGLSQAELDLASEADVLAVRMGPRILRTETAPIAALAVIQSKYGDW